MGNKRLTKKQSTYNSLATGRSIIPVSCGRFKALKNSDETPFFHSYRFGFKVAFLRSHFPGVKMSATLQPCTISIYPRLRFPKNVTWGLHLP
jgi:hypothetical protein